MPKLKKRKKERSEFVERMEAKMKAEDLMDKANQFAPVFHQKKLLK